jgi:hypothetical protein
VLPTAPFAPLDTSLATEPVFPAQPPQLSMDILVFLVAKPAQLQLQALLPLAQLATAGLVINPLQPATPAVCASTAQLLLMQLTTALVALMVPPPQITVLSAHLQ